MRDATGPLGTGSTACTPSERDRARAWFQDASVAPMSFRWLCLVLDLDPEAVAKRIDVSAGDEDAYAVLPESVERVACGADG